MHVSKQNDHGSQRSSGTTTAHVSPSLLLLLATAAVRVSPQSPSKTLVLVRKPLVKLPFATQQPRGFLRCSIEITPSERIRYGGSIRLGFGWR